MLERILRKVRSFMELVDELGILGAVKYKIKSILFGYAEFDFGDSKGVAVTLQLGKPETIDYSEYSDRAKREDVYWKFKLPQSCVESEKWKDMKWKFRTGIA